MVRLMSRDYRYTSLATPLTHERSCFDNVHHTEGLVGFKDRRENPCDFFVKSPAQHSRIESDFEF